MNEIATEVEHKEPNYALIFWSLLILTILELFVANLHFLPRLQIILSLVSLAIIKASLVALFYMHLKFEKLLIYIIFAIPFILSFILVLLTITDNPLAR